jgi:hypothetical protein
MSIQERHVEAKAGLSQITDCSRSATTFYCGDRTCLNIKILEQSHNQNHGIVEEVHGKVVNCGELSGVDPNCPWKPLQSRAYIGPNLKAVCGNKLGVRPHLDPEEKSVNEIRTGG